MDYMERLEAALSDLETNAGKLANLPELVQNIKELISLYKKACEEFGKSEEEMRTIETLLRNRIDELEKALKREQESKDELMNAVRSALTANNKEQLDAVQSVTTVVGNKITVAESNLTVKATENGTKLDSALSGIAALDSKTGTYGDKAEKDFAELKQMAKKTQMLATVAAVLALVACILSVVM